MVSIRRARTLATACNWTDPSVAMEGRTVKTANECHIQSWTDGLGV